MPEARAERLVLAKEDLPHSCKAASMICSWSTSYRCPFSLFLYDGNYDFPEKKSFFREVLEFWLIDSK
jgi:hypothetical protein